MQDLAWRNEVLTADVPRLRTLARHARQAKDAGTRAAAQTKFDALLHESRTRRAQRAAALPQPTFPADLPVSAQRDAIAQALLQHPVVIVCGETGSGKTTQLPKICLSIGRGASGLIGHTQPRRIAARTTAARIAQELATELGQTVGFKVRFTDQVNERTAIKLMTDGILLAETQSDPSLSAYDTLIIDEAHERSANIDFLLGYLHTLRRRRPDLKIIITSATLDAERFAAHFADAAGRPAPVFEVSGRLYPIEIRYRPFEAERTDKRDWCDALMDAVDELQREGPGDVLVFLPGEREIREAAEALRKAPHHPGMQPEILPLYARQSAAEQARVFSPGAARRIVLATNVAETSLTVPRIRYVVDSGLARIKRYSLRNKVEQLPVEKISQAAANQRAGRCGRVMDGVCIRLYDEADFAARPPHTEPEILRSSLAGIILRMGALNLGAVEHFPFLDAPSPRSVQDGYRLLVELGAVEDSAEHALTALGRELARLPLDPKIGRMLLAARREGCLAEMLIIAAALSTQDVRERPRESPAAADQAHARFRGDETARQSEFLWFCELWRQWSEVQRHESSSRQKAWCRTHFLSWLRMREWRDVHAQLRTLALEHGWRENDAPAPYAAIHRALLSGLLGHIGMRIEDARGAQAGGYTGARGITFWPHPGSLLGKKTAKWIVCAELMETSRLFGRCLARIEPQWVEEIGAHLLRQHLSEPHWSKSQGAVRALARGTVHGLPVYTRRSVPYRDIDPALCRTLLIREGLIAGEIDAAARARMPFLQHNQKLVAEIERLEQKARRPDVLVDDSLIEAFYDARIPAHVVDLVTLTQWRKEAEREQPRLLFLSREALMRHDAEGITSERFPPVLEVFGQPLPLEYRHHPGEADDGVTLVVPLPMLNQIPATRCEWLVPGLLGEKVQALFKGVPQKHRHRLQPLKGSAEAFLAACAAGEFSDTQPLLRALQQFVQARIGLALPVESFRPENLPPHCFMNFRVEHSDGRVLGQSRNLAELRQRLGNDAAAQLRQAAARPAQDAPARAAQSAPEPAAAVHDKLTTWSFGELPELIELTIGGQSVIGFPALVDEGDSVALRAFDTPEEATRIHRQGLLRLFALHFRDQVRAIEKAPEIRALALQFIAFGTEAELRAQLVAATLTRACMMEPWPQNADEFTRRINEARPRIGLIAQEWIRLTERIVTAAATAHKRLGTLKAFPDAAEDIRAQLAELLPKDFLLRHDWSRLAHFPRYLDAIRARLDKLRNHPDRDAAALRDWQALAQPFRREWLQRLKSGTPDAALEDYRWLLEELRVHLYAQELRTPMPVSVKRLQKIWQTRPR